MRVLFDGYWWVEGPFSNRAVQREFVQAWAQRYPEDEIALAVPRAHVGAAVSDAPASARIFGARLRPHGVACALEYPILARRFHADITITHNFAPLIGHSAIFLHDVLFQSNPEWFTPAERLYYAAMPVLAPRAAQVFTSSATEASRVRAYNRRLRNVTPVGLAVATDLRDAEPHPPALVDDPGIAPGRYLLCVARLNVRKNLATAIEAALMSGAVSPDFPLIIVGEEEGRVGQLSASTTQAITDGRVRMLARASNSELSWLYRHAAVFLFPSLDEGFGLPPVEALSFGCPVIASDIPVLRETLGEDASFANPTDPRAFAERISEVLAGSRERPRLPAGRLNTWRRSVERMRCVLAPGEPAQHGPA